MRRTIVSGLLALGLTTVAAIPADAFGTPTKHLDLECYNKSTHNSSALSWATLYWHFKPGSTSIAQWDEIEFSQQGGMHPDKVTFEPSDTDVNGVYHVVYQKGNGARGSAPDYFDVSAVGIESNVSGTRTLRMRVYTTTSGWIGCKDTEDWSNSKGF